MTQDQYLYWCLTEAESAFQGGRSELALRYVGKALERLRCMYCHGQLDGLSTISPYFKGFLHDECREKYSGRGDYLLQHPESQ